MLPAVLCLLFFLQKGQAQIVNQRMFTRTYNMSWTTFRPMVTYQRTMDSYTSCGKLCVHRMSTCNGFYFRESDHQCFNAQVTQLEDCAPGSSINIFVDVVVADNVDQICRGGYHCCNRDKVDFPCQAGEGDCQNDVDCSPGLVCGKGSCSTLYKLTGYQWDSGDNCCRPKCQASTPCGDGEGRCSDVSQCANSTWSQCVRCTDTSDNGFPTQHYSDIAPENYKSTDLCCKRNCHPWDLCYNREVGCSWSSDCGPGLQCVLSAGQPTCLDFDECLSNPCPSSSVCINIVGTYRCSVEDGVAVILGGNSFVAEAFTRDNKTCQHKIPNFIRTWNDAASIFVDGYLYVCGGTSHSTSAITATVTRSDCRRLNVNEAAPTWTTIASMKLDRKDFSMATWNGKIYAFMGRWKSNSSSYYSNTGWRTGAEKYDPSTNVWTQLTDYYQTSSYYYQTYDTCTVVDDVNKRALVIGGINENYGQIDNIAVFNFTNERWLTRNWVSLPHTATQVGCAIMQSVKNLGRMLVVTGGLWYYGSSYSDRHSWIMYLDVNTAWHKFSTVAPFYGVTYMDEALILPLNDYEAHYIGNCNNYSSSDCSHRTKMYKWLDETMGGPSGRPMMINNPALSRISRYAATGTVIPRSSAVLDNC